MTTDHYLTIRTPLDATSKRERKFTIQSLAGEEGISRDFSYRLQLSSLERLTDDEIRKLMGQSITVDIAYLDPKSSRRQRYINGIVYHLEELGMSRYPSLPDIWQYEIDIGSWFRKLDFIKDCRIFQKSGNTCIKLISDLLREYGFYDFHSDIKSSLPRRDYKVLYNEAISRFISGMLREDGIIWRFEHFDNKHVMVFSDYSTAFPEISDRSIARGDRITSFCRTSPFNPVQELSEASFAWENPPVKKIVLKKHGDSGHLKHYVYTGRYADRTEGEEKIRRDVLSADCQRNRYAGESTIRAFAAGTVFKLYAPIVPEHNQTFLIETLKIEATDHSYRNTFTVIPAKLPYFLPRDLSGAENRMMGPQTAFVIGEGGAGSVQTDNLGRIRVQFHWSHPSPNNKSPSTSAYVRVAMPAAGDKRGFLFNPRVGEEVIVDFEDGNPEKPFIVGCVYSKNNPPPFVPSSKPYRSIIKNDRHPDANQVIFEDKPGSEVLEITARKEMNIDVNNNMTIDVTKDMKVTATAQNIRASEGVDISAGNEINHQSLVSILNLAALASINTAGGNILNLAAGIVKQAAGGILTNLAGVLMANTSVMGITHSAEGEVTTESKMMMLNTAPNVINTGENTMDNKAALGILNKAQTEMINKGKSKEDKISLMSQSEARKFVVKGDTKVGP